MEGVSHLGRLPTEASLTFIERRECLDEVDTKKPEAMERMERRTSGVMVVRGLRQGVGTTMR